jgi:beta-lactamase regulating signal transducer with metallopeptidase domain
MDALLSLPQNCLLAVIGLLDAVPDGARAALAALLLVWFLRLFEIRIPRHEVQYGQSFRKSALAALVVIPAFVWLVPASRMTVFVEELEPSGMTSNPIWLVLLLLWLSGVLAAGIAFLRAQRCAAREMASLPVVEDDKLTVRLTHWRLRLGMETALVLVEVPGTDPRFLSSGNRVAIPAAARHWPGSLQDVLLIVALAHLKRRHRRWHLIGQLIGCLYWPVPWVQRLADHLIQDFQQSADGLAESCYRDRMGYDRALRQLEQRLGSPAGDRTAGAVEEAADRLPARITASLRDYLRSLLHLLDPATEPPWRLDDLLLQRSSEQKLAWTDPYDKVVVFVGQAVFFSFLLTGATLEERPPEVDYEYSMPFELFWKEHFHRNLELQEKLKPPAS